MNDEVDQKDHESMYLDDYLDSMLDLEDTTSTGTSMHDQPGVIPANTMMSTDTEAAGGMLNLSMGASDVLESHRQDEPDTSHSSAAPSDDEQFHDMFKIPYKVPECRDQSSVTTSGLDFWALMAEAQFRSSRRMLPPPPELRPHYKDDKHTRNVIVKSLQKPKVAEVPVANLRNTDPLDLARDASQDAALEHMKERRRKESCSSSTASRSSSASKRHRSSSQSGDKTNPKKGRPTSDQEPSMPDKGVLPPHQPSSAPAHKFTLNKVQSVVQPTPDKIASCGKGQGQVITEKLQEMAMGPAARSRYTRKENSPRKASPKKSGFPTREEMEARKRCEAQKDRVVNHQVECIGERYLSLKQHIGRFPQEIKALQFFKPEGKEVDLACQVIAIADWAIEYNEFSTHPIPGVPTELQVLHSRPRHGRGQFPLAPTLEESSSTNVRIRCQAQWIYLCAILQYFEDDMATREGALYGGKTRWPSTLVQYIIERVNPGLPEHFRVEWPIIVGSTPWLIAWEHMTQEDWDRLNNEPPPDMVLDLEVATEEVYERQCQDNARRVDNDQLKDIPQNPPDTLPQATREASMPPPEEQPHKFVPDSNWMLITGKTGQNVDLSETSAQVETLGGKLVDLTDLDKELGVEDVQEVLDNYLTEDTVAVQNLICIEPGLTGGEILETVEAVVEAAEVMEVDPPMVFMAESTHLPMDTRLLDVPLGAFQPELTAAGYTPSLIGSMDTPPSPITAEDNALLDVADPVTQPPETSKAPGARRPESSLGQESPSKPGMTLWKRKPPPT